MFKSCVCKQTCVSACMCVCVRMCAISLCVGERAWDEVMAHREAVVMATEDVVLFCEISAVPESNRPRSSLFSLCNT